MDVTVAYRQTTLRKLLQLLPISKCLQITGCIEYLRRFGYSDYQVYLLLSCAPVQGHVAGIVDIPKYIASPFPLKKTYQKLTSFPSACTTLGLPMDIFDFDISPTGPAKKLDMGSCAFETGVKEGKITQGGKNSEISWGGGLTYKEKSFSVVENLKEKVVGT
jgi:formamidase